MADAAKSSVNPEGPGLTMWGFTSKLGQAAVALLGPQVGIWLLVGGGAAAGVAAAIVGLQSGYSQGTLLLLLVAVILDSAGRRAMTDRQVRPLLLFLGDATAPLRIGVATLLTVSASGPSAVELVAALFFVMALFLDWSSFRIVLKIRGAYRSLYAPTPLPGDGGLCRFSDRMRARGLAPVPLGYDEIVLIGAVIGPAMASAGVGFAVAVILGVSVNYGRLLIASAELRRAMSA